VSLEPFLNRAIRDNAQIVDDQAIVGAAYTGSAFVAVNVHFTFQTPLLLTFVLGVAATKDALEDIRKHTADDVQNNRTTSTLQKDGKEELNAWKDVKDGKIFKLKNCELQAGSSGAKSKIQKNIEGSPVKLSPFIKIVNKQTVYMLLLFLTANVTAALVATESNS